MGPIGGASGTRTSACTDISPTSLHKRNQQVLWCRSRLWSRGVAREGGPSGYARSALGREAYSDARPGEHVDQVVDDEAMEAPSHEIVHAGLAYPQELHRPGLRSRRRAMRRSSASMSSARTRRCSASTGDNPRSRKMLGEPFVILIAIVLAYSRARRRSNSSRRALC